MAIVVITAAFLLGACGDGGSSISKEEFLEKANKICSDGEAKLEADTGDIDVSSMSEDELAQVIADVVIPNIRGQISDIRDLGFPDGDEDELDAMFDDIESILSDLEDDPSGFLTEEDPFADVTGRLTAYGLTECS